MKQLAKTAIRFLVRRAPWGVRDAALNGICDRIGYVEVSKRLFPKLHISEVGVWGDCGVIASAWNDRMVLPEYARTGTFESMMVREIQTFFGQQGGTYIDIGANIGLTTIPIARNPLVRCLAFEPEPGNFHFLRRNVERNVPNNSVELHQLALFDHHATVSLAVADDNLGDHRVTLNGIPGRPTIEVPAVPLDEFHDRVRGPLAIKVDTQGAEPYVVAGAQRVLREAGLLVMEFCPFLMRELGGDPHIVIELLSDFDTVALVEDTQGPAPTFLPPADAQRRLREKLRTARDVDADYLDIVAKRVR